MIVHVKVVKVTEQGEERSTLYPCSHVVSTRYPREFTLPDGSVAQPGDIHVEICSDTERHVEILSREGDVAYFLNEHGSTVDTRRFVKTTPTPSPTTFPPGVSK